MKIDFATILIINLLFINSISFAEPKCQTEIRVNDSRAVIEVDGFPVATGRYTLSCKPVSQHVTVKAPNKMRFVRMMPAASDFDIKDSFWNVRLLTNSIEPTFTEAVRSNSGQPEELLEMLEPKLQALSNEKGQPSADKTASAFAAGIPDRETSSRAPAALAAIAGAAALAYVSPFEPAGEYQPEEEIKNSRRPAAVAHTTARDLFVDPDRKLKGIYVQVRALPGIKKDAVIAAENVHHMADKLEGTDVTMCPAFVPETNKTWTKLLVGPVPDQNEANKLAKNYGYGSFVIRDPPCPVTKNDSFRM